MPWSERPECWVPSRGETRKDARRVSVSYATDDPRTAASLAAQKYAEENWNSADPFDHMRVRVRTSSGTYDVLVNVEAVPAFHAEFPVPVEDAP